MTRLQEETGEGFAQALTFCPAPDLTRAGGCSVSSWVHGREIAHTWQRSNQAGSSCAAKNPAGEEQTQILVDFGEVEVGWLQVKMQDGVALVLPGRAFPQPGVPQTQQMFL